MVSKAAKGADQSQGDRPALRVLQRPDRFPAIPHRGQHLLGIGEEGLARFCQPHPLVEALASG